MPLTPFVKYDRDWETHVGYDEFRVGRIHSHTTIIPASWFSVSNLSDFPIVITLTAYRNNGDGTTSAFVLVDQVTAPISDVYVHPAPLVLLAGDYLTAQATDQGQFASTCRFNTFVQFKELLET